MEDEISIVWGQDLPHCEDHCYEAMGDKKWRCLNSQHVAYEDCSEDFLHCKIDFVIIENRDGLNNYCGKHQKERKLLEVEK